MRVVGFARLPGVKGSAAAASSGSSGGGGLLGLALPADALAFFEDAAHFVNTALWILNPENWLRILAGAAAVLLAVSGLVFLVKAA